MDARVLELHELANITYAPTSNTIIGKLESSPTGVFPKFLSANIHKKIGFTPFSKEPDTSCSSNEVINGTSELPDSCTNKFGAATLFCLSVRELLIKLKPMVNHDYSIPNILLNLNSLLGLDPSKPIPKDAIISCWRVLNPKFLRRPCGNLPAVDRQSCNYNDDELPLKLCEIDNSNRLHHLKKIADINGLCSDEDGGYPFSGTGATYDKTKSDKVGVLEMICIQAKINKVIAEESINMTKLSELLQLPEVDIYMQFDPDNILRGSSTTPL